MDDERGAFRIGTMAKYLDLPIATMHRVVLRPDFPKPAMLNDRAKLWSRNDVMAWLRSLITNGSDNGAASDRAQPNKQAAANDDGPEPSRKRPAARAQRVRKGCRV